MLLATLCGVAQQTIKSNNLDVYVGTWENRTGSNHFTLVLKKGVCKLNNSVFDCLIGGYEYKQNGKVVTSYLDSIPSEVTEANLYTYYD